MGGLESALSIDSALAEAPTITIESRRTVYWNLKELWNDREILRSLVWRDISVRYKETLIGFLWVVLQPLLLMVILSSFFWHLGDIGEAKVPIHVRIFASLLVWDFIAGSLERAGTSLLQNAGVISKIYFCRLILPLTPIGASGFDFLIKCGVLALLMAYYRVVPPMSVLLLPLLLAGMVLFTASLCVWLAALTAFYKDIALTIPFVLRALFFLSPVFYEAHQVVTPPYQFVFHLNPIAALIESFNRLVLGTDLVPTTGIALAMGGSLLLGLTGISFFRYVESSIVDVL